MLPLVSTKVTVLCGPKPWPTALIAITANPARARVGATAVGPPKRLSPKPCPKITTGYPPAGFGSRGQQRVEVYLVGGVGAPSRLGSVGAWRMVWSASRKFGEL